MPGPSGGTKAKGNPPIIRRSSDGGTVRRNRTNSPPVSRRATRSFSRTSSLSETRLHFFGHAEVISSNPRLVQRCDCEIVHVHATVSAEQFYGVGFTGAEWNGQAGVTLEVAPAAGGGDVE